MLIVGTLIVWALGVCAARAADPPASTQAPAPAANPATAQELPQVVVIANAPLSGLGLPANEIPANVQTADSRQMQRQQSLDLADYLNAGFSGVSASGSAANPFQMDVNYHGFTASPLLGTPEGLSVYVDGVRVNESFGDTVNWDLIPQAAISTVTLMSGSNPVFGLNTLGGALLLRTKSGHDNQNRIRNDGLEPLEHAADPRCFLSHPIGAGNGSTRRVAAPIKNGRTATPHKPP
ncbi:MAG: Plug domain-containing protein [Gammaproteobacteria bacterium]|nr:MAG: Plug domain-containing protein [Gammaproteobacteria bacterium]